MPNLLLLSPYDGASHRYWREGLSRYLRTRMMSLDITEMTMPARYFSWRQRGNSLGYAFSSDLPEQVDLIIATSMTDLSALRGLNRRLATIPAIVYFHENQFAYPDSLETGRVERQMTSIYTALSADHLCFNSEFNRRTFLDGAGELLKKMPDQVPRGVLSALEAKSEVLPVAIEVPDTVLKEAEPPPQKRRLRIAWNHRHEHDKGPETLLAIVQMLIERNVDVEISLFGEAFRQVPHAFTELTALLASSGRLAHSGFVKDRKNYLKQLASHHIVLSTARQEFQGLAIQEAMLLGCHPIVPDALSYPEYVPRESRYSTPTDAADLIQHLASQRPQHLGSEQDLSASTNLNAYRWDQLGPVWLQRIESLLASSAD